MKGRADVVDLDDVCVELWQIDYERRVAKAYDDAVAVSAPGR